MSTTPAPAPGTNGNGSAQVQPSFRCVFVSGVVEGSHAVQGSPR